MIVTVIGKEHKEGFSKKTARPYSCTIAYCTHKQAGVSGEACETIWIDDDFRPFEEIIVGKKYNADRTRSGFLCGFDPVG